MSVAHSHPRPRLADHVRACLCGDQLIFLDLLRSKYVGVGGPGLHRLSELILDRSSSEPPASSPSNSGLVEDWIKSLVRQQLLTETVSLRNPRGPKLLEPIASVADDDGRGDHLGWPRLPRLWSAALVTSTWLRKLSLADIEQRVLALRARYSSRDRSLDTEALCAIVGTYMRLRPFVLSSHDRCLNDSLALVHFLAGLGFFPQWVIGVRVDPFCAHSWVQQAGVVLNDQPEHVRSYQPILIV
jgi:hypothetical protein